MRRWMALMSAAAFVLLLLAATPATASAFLAKQKTAQGVEFLSGGVGKDERDAMKQHAKAFNTHLVFADSSGKFLSAVAVRITDAKGKAVLETTTQGPWLYANLPAGSYDVAAVFQGKEQKRRIQVGAEPVTSLFQWKAGR
ncbi:MAG: carboxypeptidase-like regulatory domain-containing protein [Desulfobacterales bacterium]